MASTADTARLVPSRCGPTPNTRAFAGLKSRRHLAICNGVLHLRDFSDDTADRGGGPDLLGIGGSRGYGCGECLRGVAEASGAHGVRCGNGEPEPCCPVTARACENA